MVNIARRRGGTAQSSTASSLSRLPCTPSRAIFIAITISLTIYILSIRSILQSPKSYNNAVAPPDSPHRLADAAVATSTTKNDDAPITIAHAISLIKCSKGPSVTGFLDAAAVLRHSIHKNSIHYKDANSGASSSKYSYQMYAIVHPSCEQHAMVLKRLGYEIVVKDHPVKAEDIRGEWLKKHIEGENCCGSAEFIKLYGEILFF